MAAPITPEGEMHEVLKSFPYSADGIRVKTLEAGAMAEIRADLVQGLEAEGFIRRATLPLSVPAAAVGEVETRAFSPGEIAGPMYSIRRAHQGKFVVVGPNGKDASVPMTKAAAEAEAARLSAE